MPREDFQQWILGNGFRDACEAINGFLDGTRTVLAAWHLAIRQSFWPASQRGLAYNPVHRQRSFNT